MTHDPAPDTSSEDELRRSSSEFLAEVDRLAELERRKRDLPTGHEDRLGLAVEIEDTTLGLMGLGRYQTRLIEHQTQASSDAPAERSPRIILDEWRAAERRLLEARTALNEAMDQADRLRTEHRDSVRRR